MANIAKNKKLIYYVALSIILVGSIYALLRLSPVLITPGNLASDDFVHYWASGKLNLDGLNPFDAEKTQQIRLDLGSPDLGPGTPSITLTPPWVLPLLMMSGAINYPMSRVLWLLASILALFFASQVFWSIYGGTRKYQWLGLLAVFIFSPTISVLEKGQITYFLVLGLAGFLYFTAVKHNDWLAGACLALVTFKPQLVLILGLAVLFWVIIQRRWKILIGTALTILCLTMIAWLYNPGIVGQYLGMIKSYGLADWATPTIGSYLRFFWLGTDHFWIQYLPTFFGVAWLIYYELKLWKAWDWKITLPILLLASVLTSPYAWTYDQVILVPMIIQAVVWLTTPKSDYKTVIYLAIFLTFNLLSLFLHMKLDEFWFIWFAPTIIGWYLLIRRQSVFPVKQAGYSTQLTG